MNSHDGGEQQEDTSTAATDTRGPGGRAGATVRCQYTALDSGGRTVSGEIEASDRNAAVRAIREQGLFPTEVRIAGQTTADPGADTQATSERSGTRRDHPLTKLGGVLAALGWGYFILPTFGYQFIVLKAAGPTVAVVLIVTGTALVFLDVALTIRGWMRSMRARRRAKPLRE